MILLFLFCICILSSIFLKACANCMCFPPQVLRVRTPTFPSCSGHPVNCVWPAIMNSMDRNLCGT